MQNDTITCDTYKILAQMVYADIVRSGQFFNCGDDYLDRKTLVKVLYTYM